MDTELYLMNGIMLAFGSCVWGINHPAFSFAELAVRANKVAETHSKAIELTQVPIQHGNPAHKILFLTRLGLTPKSGMFHRYRTYE